VRYYSLADWLQTLEKLTGADHETLKTKLVDMTAAIMALRSAGGLADEDDEPSDVADAICRLLVHMVGLRPFRGGGPDAVAAATAIAYARNRGYTLNLPERGLPLVQCIQTQSLGLPHVERAVRRGLLRDVPEKHVKLPKGLRTASACLSFAVSNPSPELMPVTGRLCDAIEGILRRQGAQVHSPYPREHISATGMRGGARVASGRPARTHELFTRSIQRLTQSHVLVIVADPRLRVVALSGSGLCG
jgi:hypothetical protein